jgi:hypothetical protein
MLKNNYKWYNHPDILWIKLDQSFFSLQRDIYLAVVYISPEYSNGIVNDIEQIYSVLLSDIVLSDIIVQGDFNAYTNTQPDFVMFDAECISSDNVLYQPDKIMSRNNLDHKHVNNSGKNLFNLCKESGLRILNCRTAGDLTGQPTCITYNGCIVTSS